MSSNLGSNQLCNTGSDLFNDDTEFLLPTSENSSPNHNGQQPRQQLFRHTTQCGVGGRRLSQAPSCFTRTFGGSLFTLPQPQLEPGVFRSLNYPAFQSLRTERVYKTGSYIFDAAYFMMLISVREPRCARPGCDLRTNCADVLKAHFSTSHEPSHSIYLWR